MLADAISARVSAELPAIGHVNGHESLNTDGDVICKRFDGDLTCGFTVERVTGIEPALSARESVPSGPVAGPDLRGGVSASDRLSPGLMARSPHRS
jgi:hypothetical protein